MYATNIKTLALLLMLSTGGSILGQTQKDSARVFKNELGINLIPFANSSYASLNLFYKRQVKGNWFGRLAVIVLNVDTDNGIKKIVPVSQSTIGIEFKNGNPKQYLQYNLGIEKRYGRGKIKQFFGFDAGYASYNYETTLLYGERDGISSSSPYANTGVEQAYQRSTDVIIAKYKTTSNSMVFNPFYGLQFNISRRLFFTSQLGCSFTYSRENYKYSVDNRLIKYRNDNHTTLNLNFSSVSSNFALCYRF